MRSLGLDIGDKRIGVALSDPEGILASPFTIISRTDDAADIENITGIIRQHEVKQVIVGLPRSMDGSMGGQAEKVEAFTRRLCSHTEVPVEFRDERLTTVSAKRLMQSVDRKRTKTKLVGRSFTYNNASFILRVFYTCCVKWRNVAF